MYILDKCEKFNRKTMAERACTVDKKTLVGLEPNSKENVQALDETLLNTTKHRMISLPPDVEKNLIEDFNGRILETDLSKFIGGIMIVANPREQTNLSVRVSAIEYSKEDKLLKINGGQYLLRPDYYDIEVCQFSATIRSKSENLKSFTLLGGKTDLPNQQK